MSIVGCIKKNGKVFVGSDSMVSYGDSYADMEGSKYVKKPFYKDSDMDYVIFCYSGDLPRSNEIIYSFRFPVWDTDEIETFNEYVFSYLLPDMRKYYKDNDIVKKKNGGNTLEISFLLIYKDEFITIYDDLTASIDTTHNYTAIGSGKTKFMSIMKVLYDRIKDPEEILETCLLAVTELDPYCGGNINISEV